MDGFPKFYFAWVDPETAFNEVAHAVTDETIVSFKVEHLEGEFASLNILVENPGIPLLQTGRKVWAWLSWDDGTGVVPLFLGRLVGVPGNIHRETVSLEFLARPADFVIQKSVLAESLRVPPYWDEVFIDEAQVLNPDSAWEARSEVLHIDRVTHTVTSSDVLSGEDGVAEFLPSEVPYESVEQQINESAARSITVNADVNWSQRGSGEFPVFENKAFVTFGADNLASDWPKTGAKLDGGWQVAFGEATHTLDRYKDDAFETHITLNSPPPGEDSIEVIIEPSVIGLPVPDDWMLIITDIDARTSSGVDGANIYFKKTGTILPIGTCYGTLRIKYAAARKRKERIHFTLETDIQSILTEPEDQETLLLEITGRDVGAVVDEYGDTAIGDEGRRSYFDTDRGLRSVEYLLMLARARLAVRSRAIQVTFQCLFSRAVTLSCRMNAQLFDHRLPGGTALGKITGYSFEVGGGKMVGSVSIDCAIGRGGTVAEVAGDPVYAQVGYVERGYQQYTGRVVVLSASSVGYEVPTQEPNDDGLTFPLVSAPLLEPPIFTPVIPIGGRFVQVPETAWNYAWMVRTNSLSARTAFVVDMLKLAEASIELRLQPVDGGPFVTDYYLVTTDLKLPAMINLGD